MILRAFVHTQHTALEMGVERSREKMVPTAVSLAHSRACWMGLPVFPPIMLMLTRYPQEDICTFVHPISGVM